MSPELMETTTHYESKGKRDQEIRITSLQPLPNVYLTLRLVLAGRAPS